MPLAATSVAIRMLHLPFLKLFMTCVRCICFISPCRPTAAKPRFCRASVSSSTIFLVLQNTIEETGFFDASSRCRASVFLPIGTLMAYCAMASTVRCGLWICTIWGSFWYCLVMARIAGGIVAENKTVWRSSGVWARTDSISSRNPMFSISSASSNTIVRRCSSLRVRRRRWSKTLPGVPTTMFAPFFRAWICRSMLAPPYTATGFTHRLNFANLPISSQACMASSLVGQRIRA